MGNDGMGMITVHASLAEANDSAATVDKLLAYPVRGAHLRTSPKQQPIVQAWDGKGARPVGWTTTASRVVKHPSRDEWAVKSTVDTAAALSDERADKLTEQERTALGQASKLSVTLSEWQASAAPIETVKR